MSTQPRNPKRARKKEGQQRRREAELAAMKRQRRTSQIKRVVVIGALLLGSLFLVQQLTKDDKKTDVSATSSTTLADSATTTTAARTPVVPLTCAPPSGDNTDLTTKPTVAVPAEPATKLTCQDLVVGDGEEVPAGATVSAQYVGVAQSTGTQFDASWDNGGKPIDFSLDGVIPGWTQGIPGMKVGGRRLLVIPGDLAYGPAGQQQAGIGPNETLVFIVDITAITPVTPATTAGETSSTTTP